SESTGVMINSIMPSLSTKNSLDDYDWAVYNLSNASCSDIATNAALEVSCNFSGSPGDTGPTSSTPPGAAFNLPISVYAGESYVVNVSNWTGSGSGFTLDFSNSTSLAYDTTLIAINSITNLSTLDGLLVIMNEAILCSQIDSGDFEITDPNGMIIPIQSAVPLSCDSSFADSIALYLDPQITPAQLLTFSVALTAEVVYLCSSDSVNTMPLPIASLNTGIMTQNLSSNGNICQGDSVLLSTPFTGVSGFQSVWMPGNIQAEQLMIIADSSINYTVTTQQLVGTLLGNDDIKLETDSKPDWFKLTDVTSCEKSVIIGSKDSSLTYLWSNNSSKPNFEVNSNQAGIYTVIVSNANGCSVMDTIAVNFATYPVLQPNFVVGSSPLAISFNSNASNVDSVSWDFGDGNVASGLSANHTYSQSGSYQVIITAHSMCGDKLDSLNVDAFASSLGGQYLPDVKLWLSSQSLHLELPQFQAPYYELVLLDLNGKQVQKTYKVEATNSTWPLTHLPQGMYLAKVVDPNGRTVYLSKLVKL
ncbi:MAG: PKD domain-containing protein, partial [Bacteroidota bacterium]